MRSDGWPAPAKLNLFLHVVGRRADGYHLLQSVFQFLDRCDELGFRVSRAPGIARSRPLPGVPEASDLTLRAARLLRQHTGCSLGVEIDVVKRLPLGGGLGGGSSDAATTLVALNQLWGLNLPPPTLADIGLRLGADVPVFVQGLAAWAEGVGERLTPVALPEIWFLVVTPAVSVATENVFNDPDLTRDSPLMTMSDFLGGGCGNDCQSVVFKRYPEVAAAARALGRYGDARLTGTGSCVFAGFESESAARAAHDSMTDAGHRCFVARGRNRSSLLARLERVAGDREDMTIGP